MNRFFENLVLIIASISLLIMTLSAVGFKVTGEIEYFDIITLLLSTCAVVAAYFSANSSAKSSTIAERTYHLARIEDIDSVLRNTRTLYFFLMGRSRQTIKSNLDYVDELFSDIAKVAPRLPRAFDVKLREVLSKKFSYANLLNQIPDTDEPKNPISKTFKDQVEKEFEDFHLNFCIELTKLIDELSKQLKSHRGLL